MDTLGSLNSGLSSSVLGALGTLDRRTPLSSTANSPRSAVTRASNNSRLLSRTGLPKEPEFNEDQGVLQGVITGGLRKRLASLAASAAKLEDRVDVIEEAIRSIEVELELKLGKEWGDQVSEYVEQDRQALQVLTGTLVNVEAQLSKTDAENAEMREAMDVRMEALELAVSGLRNANGSTNEAFERHTIEVEKEFEQFEELFQMFDLDRMQRHLELIGEVTDIHLPDEEKDDDHPVDEGEEEEEKVIDDVVASESEAEVNKTKAAAGKFAGLLGAVRKAKPVGEGAAEQVPQAPSGEKERAVVEPGPEDPQAPEDTDSSAPGSPGSPDAASSKLDKLRRVGKVGGKLGRVQKAARLAKEAESSASSPAGSPSAQKAGKSPLANKRMGNFKAAGRLASLLGNVKKVQQRREEKKKIGADGLAKLRAGVKFMMAGKRMARPKQDSGPQMLWQPPQEPDVDVEDLQAKVNLLMEAMPEKADAEDTVETRNAIDRIEEKIKEIQEADKSRPNLAEMVDQIQILGNLNERLQKEVNSIIRELHRKVDEEDFKKLSDDIFWVQKEGALLRKQMMDKVGPEKMEYLSESIKLLRTQVTTVERCAQNKAEKHQVHEQNEALATVQNSFTSFQAQMEEKEQKQKEKEAAAAVEVAESPKSKVNRTLSRQKSSSSPKAKARR